MKRSKTQDEDHRAQERTQDLIETKSEDCRPLLDLCKCNSGRF